MKLSTRLTATGAVLAVIASSAAVAQSQPGGQRQPKATGEQWNSLSKQEKADYCNQAAQKKGLTGQDRANFLKQCVNAQAAPKQ